MEKVIVVNGNCKEIVKDVLFQETCEILVENGRNMLAVTASARVTSVETFENEMRVGVKTEFRAITRDEEGNYHVEQGECESTKGITANGILPTSKVCLNARVTDCEKVSLSPFKARATVEIYGWFIKDNEIVFLNTERDDLYCKTEKSAVENVLPLADNVLTLNFTDEMRMPVGKILDYTGAVVIDSVYPSSGSYRAEGDLSFRIVAIADNGQFITQNFSHPFTAENAEEFLTSDMRLDVEGALKNLSFTVNDSDKRVIVCDASIKVYGVALEEREVDKAVDVYSTKNELTVDCDKKTVNTHFCLRSVREKAVSTVSVGGGINEILCVTSPVVSVTGTMNADNITADGVISATVIYLDETSNVRSTACEVPFVSNLSGEYPCETVFEPEVTITALYARPRGSGDVEVTAEMLVSVRGVQSKEMDVISDVTVGEEKETDDFAISLYIVKEGQTLWDVAKELNVDETTLSVQNPDVSQPLRPGEKILLYKGL